MEKAIVIIPTYNERENIEDFIRAIFKVVPQIDVLVVDDSSPDGTGQIVENLKLEFPNLKIIHRKEHGWVGAILTGFRRAITNGYSALITIDADFSHDPAMIPLFLEKISTHDLVIGSRFVPGGSIEGNRSYLRQFLTYLGGAFARIVLGLTIRDVTAGYKCYKINILKDLDFNFLKSKRGPAFQIETLYYFKLKGYSITEIPINFVDRVKGSSKLSTKSMTEALLMVLRLRLRRIR